MIIAVGSCGLVLLALLSITVVVLSLKLAKYNRMDPYNKTHTPTNDEARNSSSYDYIDSRELKIRPTLQPTEAKRGGNFSESDQPITSSNGMFSAFVFIPSKN